MRSAKIYTLVATTCSMIGLSVILCDRPTEAGATAPELEQALCEVLQAAEYKHAHWGLYIVDAQTGQPLLEHNADRLFAPASVTKLFSVAAALDALGADYRFQTPVYRRGTVDAHGVLAGDLILVASGDLNFGGRCTADGRLEFKNVDHTYANGNDRAEWTQADPVAGLRILAEQVAAAGIRRVTGDIVIDDRLFERAEGTGSGPTRLTPIMVNDNLIDLRIVPTQPGQRARVEWRPQTALWQVDAQVFTVGPDAATRVRVGRPEEGRLVVRGQIAAGQAPLVRVAEVEDAARFARALFIECLRVCGVAVEASVHEHNDVSKLPARDAVGHLPKLAEYVSPPFAEAVRVILKVSHNLHASTLPLLVAAQRGHKTLAEGLYQQGRILERLGVDVSAISFGGGAGGARADYVTPRATVQLLRAMAGHRDFAAYYEALPILGVDGTLADAVDASSPARGKVRAKTGTLFWYNGLTRRYLLTSKALAGYMDTARGRRLMFAFFVNGVHLDKATDTVKVGRALGRLCEIVYSRM